jgi:hypothetical protein
LVFCVTDAIIACGYEEIVNRRCRSDKIRVAMAWVEKNW